MQKKPQNLHIATRSSKNLKAQDYNRPSIESQKLAFGFER